MVITHNSVEWWEKCCSRKKIPLDAFKFTHMDKMNAFDISQRLPLSNKKYQLLRHHKEPLHKFATVNEFPLDVFKQQKN